jgi:hypothetical protein
VHWTLVAALARSPSQPAIAVASPFFRARRNPARRDNTPAARAMHALFEREGESHDVAMSQRKRADDVLRILQEKVVRPSGKDRPSFRNPAAVHDETARGAPQAHARG